MSENISDELLEQQELAELADKQVEFLRKKLNDILKGAAITGSDEVPAPLLCQMADRYLEFLHRGDPAMDARFKVQPRYWYAEMRMNDHSMYIMIDIHPLAWIRSLWNSGRIDLSKPYHVAGMWEIPAEVYHELKCYHRIPFRYA